MDEFQVQEKIKAVRLPVKISDIKGQKGDDLFVFEFVKNISSDGLFISTINPLPQGEIFTVEFFLNMIKVHIRCQVEVMWSRKEEPGTNSEPGMGVRFLDLEKGIKKRIDNWIKTSTL